MTSPKAESAAKLEEAIEYSIDIHRSKSEFGYSPNEQRMILMALEIRKLRREVASLVRKAAR